MSPQGRCLTLYDTNKVSIALDIDCFGVQLLRVVIDVAMEWYNGVRADLNIDG